MINTSLKKIVLVIGIVFFASCDRDFNSVGSNILGDDNFKFNVDSTYKIVAFNKGTGSVQTNGLSINSLGIYTNPAFGKTTDNFVTQLILKEEAPIIGNNPIIDEVILYIPYFSKYKSTEQDGTRRYDLDSLYGNSKLKLSIYESGYYLRDFDPSNNFDKQRYYSDQNAVIDNNKLGQRLNNSSNPAENDAFFFNPDQYNITDNDGKITKTLLPGMYLKLDKDYFQQKIFGSGAAGKLANNNVFKDYLRGLYFKVEQIDDAGEAMIKMNFSAGNITIKYKENAPVVTDPRVEKSIVLNLTANTINLFDNNYKSEYTNALAASNPTAGDDRLYVKGGEGSIVYIDLFDDTQLAEIRAKKWLINEVNLEFYIDRTAMNGSLEPTRIYLYDTKKNVPIVDYYRDVTVSMNTKLNKSVLGGIIEKNSDKRGVKYKIRLTEHIKAIVNKDSANVRLGLVVTEDINKIGKAYLKTPFEEITQLPAYSIVNQLGTILYGATATVAEQKKLKIKIYYTKLN